MKIECIENKDLQIEIKTFIDSPQHLVAEGGLNYTFPWFTLTSSKKFWTKNWKTL